MKSLFKIVILVLIMTSCGAKKPTILSSTTNPTTKSSEYMPFFEVRNYSQDKNYGLTGDNPVKVGEQSANNQRRFLASLAGPNGEELEFYRRGSCCAYDSENGFMGKALVDVYDVTYEGLKKPILVYISFYDSEKLYIPVGFTKRKLSQ